MKRRARAAVASVLCTAFFVLAVPAFAAAHTYIVNGTADSAGASGCESSPEGECTLRGAVEASNANPAGSGNQNLINFDSTFDGGVGEDEIHLSEPLHVTSPVAIAANSCEEPVAGIAKPCVGVVAPSSVAADILASSSNVSVYDIAIGGGKVGIEVPAANGFRAAGDWFGLNLAGEPAGLSEAGIVLGSGSGAVIGQDGNGPHTAAEEKTLRNVFAHSKIGISIFGSSRATIEGNYIGVAPGGRNAAGLSVGIQATNGLVPAEEDVIGGELTEAQAESPACDGPCNVIATSGAEAVGIKLAGEAGKNVDSPSGPTLIAGNYVGLSADGKTPVGEVKYGIRAGATPGRTVGPADVTVGGLRPSEGRYSPYRNYIVGGEIGVRVDHAEGFLAAENVIGGLPGDTAEVAVGPEEAGFELMSNGVTDRPEIARNNLLLPSGATGVVSLGEGSRILVNTIRGGRTGVLTTQDDGGKGNLIQGNLILKPESFGIEIENEANVLTGDWMFEAGRAGIVLAGGGGVYPSHNRIGGDTPAEENRIEESTEGAIQIFGEPTDDNEIAGNWGTDDFQPGKGKPFIQLIGHHTAEPPNGGIKPPTVLSVEQTKASGTAVPGAKVRLFEKFSADSGELRPMVATAVADSSGHWAATLTYKLPVGTMVAATQTEAWGTSEGRTSEVSTPLAAVADREEGGGGGGGGGSGGSSGGSSGVEPSGGTGSGSTGTGSASPAPTPAPSPAAPIAPKVEITAAPRKTSDSTIATFKFKAAPAAAAKFECKLDGTSWAKCTSPKTYRKLEAGRHNFSVRAKASDRTGPVTKFQFTVKG